MNAYLLVKSDGTGPLVRPRTTNSSVVRAAVYLGLAVVDAFAVAFAFILADLLRHGELHDALTLGYYLIVPSFVVVSIYLRAYTYSSIISLQRSIMQATTALPLAVALTLLIAFATKSSDDLSRIAFFVGAAFSLALLILVRLPLPALVASLGSRFMRRLLIVDDQFEEAVPPLFEVIDAGSIGLRPDVADPLMLHSFSLIVAGADRVVISCPPDRREHWSMYLKSVGCAGELLVPELRSVKPLHSEQHLGLCGVRVSTGPLDMRNRLLKRALDLAIAAPAIVVLSPLMLLVALAIKLDSPGPILFRQRRMGRANQLFDVYKFRSMHHLRADGTGARSASRNDDRVTRVGRLIRATSIDELPQLFNIINGDMSLVGPRPHALGSTAGDQLFWHIDERYWLRHAIKPGLTGLAQVRGYRGATEHKDDLSNRLQSDLEYVSDWSVMSDLIILLRTALVLVHRNAY